MALDDVIDASVEITIGNYIVRRLEEQGVKVGSKLFVIFTLILTSVSQSMFGVPGSFLANFLVCQFSFHRKFKTKWSCLTPYRMLSNSPVSPGLENGTKSVETLDDLH